MKIVYELKTRLKKEPSYMALVQKVSLDKSKPNVGLKGNLGLFGSEQWWENIKNGVMKTSIVSGIIVRCYEAGQDRTGEKNSFELSLDNGEKWDESIYLNNPDDIGLFKINHMVVIYYAHDERKARVPNSTEASYSDTVIEMAVSYNPICARTPFTF